MPIGSLHLFLFIVISYMVVVVVTFIILIIKINKIKLSELVLELIRIIHLPRYTYILFCFFTLHLFYIIIKLN